MNNWVDVKREKYMFVLIVQISQRFIEQIKKNIVHEHKVKVLPV